MPRQHRVKFAGCVERHQIITASDMMAVDEDLRNRCPSVRTGKHIFARRTATGIAFNISDPFGIKQRLRPITKRAGKFREDFNMSAHEFYVGGPGLLVK